MKTSPIPSIFLGSNFRNLGLFATSLLTNFLSALLEGASFAFLLLSFTRFSGGQSDLSFLKFPIVLNLIEKLQFSNPLREFIFLIMIAVLLQGLRSIFVFVTACITSALALRIQTDAQLKVYQQILRLTFPCVNRFRIGDLAEYARTPSSFIPLFMDALNRCMNAVMMAGVALWFMFEISVSLTLVTLGLFTLFGLSQKTIVKKIIYHSKSLSSHLADFSKMTIQTLEGLRLIHTYHRHEKVQKDIGSVLEEISASSKKLYFWNHSIPSINETIGVVCLACVLTASLFLFDPGQGTGIAYLFTFLMLAYRASTRLHIAVGCIGIQAMYVGPILRLNDILKDEDKEFLSTSGLPFSKLSHAIEFQSVSLQYDKHLPFAITDLTLTIPRGSITAIVGPSGGGKSSILDMLIRLYEPTQGRIVLDGTPLSTFDLRSWRHSLGVVSQDSNIFNDTVEENIRFGLDEATEEEVIQAATLAGAHEFILKLSEQYQTQLGERGYKLSGGEIQRLSLARALLKNPQILILDEATSSLDSLTEHKVQQALQYFSRDRTVVINAHRLSTISFADQIIYIEQGKIVEQGTHQSLIAKEGKYAHLWKCQSQVNHEATQGDFAKIV